MIKSLMGILLVLSFAGEVSAKSKEKVSDPIKKLQDEEATLLDLGLLRLETMAHNTAETLGGAAWVQFDTHRNKIVIHCQEMLTSTDVKKKKKSPANRARLYIEMMRSIGMAPVFRHYGENSFLPESEVENLIEIRSKITMTLPDGKIETAECVASLNPDSVQCHEGNR